MTDSILHLLQILGAGAAALIAAGLLWFAVWMLGAWANKPGRETEGYTL